MNTFKLAFSAKSCFKVVVRSVKIEETIVFLVKYVCMYTSIPYSGKVWQVESLVNLTNCLQFTKLKPSKPIVTINNPMADAFIR